MFREPTSKVIFMVFGGGVASLLSAGHISKPPTVMVGFKV